MGKYVSRQASKTGIEYYFKSDNSYNYKALAKKEARKETRKVTLQDTHTSVAGSAVH